MKRLLTILLAFMLMLSLAAGVCATEPEETEAPTKATEIVRAPDECGEGITWEYKDGVLFIRPENAAALAEATRAVGQKEAAIMENILENGTYIRPWVDDLLKKVNCEIL